MRTYLSFRIFILFIFVFVIEIANAQSFIKGRVMDKKYNEPLTGAAILVEGTTNGTTADIDGNYTLTVPTGKYTLQISYVSYNTQRIQNIVVEKGKTTMVNIDMVEASLQLESVQVIAQKRTDTELSMLKSVRSAIQVVNGISSQQIGKTLDRDASEVVKRVPGVTIQDNRFVVVRGLNERYNNVWLNNAATPSSETDVKAFSFDAIPSSMIDNLLIYKTGSPELPAEATGGFVKISTKNIPDENFFNLEYNIGYNDKTTFKESYHLPSGSLDFLGLGSDTRSLPGSFPADLNKLSVSQRDAAALTMRNKWNAQPYTALPNQKLAFAFGKKWNLSDGAKLGNISSLNYSNSYNTRSNMQNYMYENFDPVTETPGYQYKYHADVYSNEFKVGLMHNWAYQTTGGTRLEFKNIFNQIGGDKTTNTQGWNTNRYSNFKFFSNQYSSRTTYSGQISGNHKLNEEKEKKLDWNVGFAYANRIEPDRQNRSMKENSAGVYEYVLPVTSSINELGRLFMTNYEYVSTGGVNYEQKLKIKNIASTLKAGAYAEYKTRNFAERSICYKATNSGYIGDDEINTLDFETLMSASYLGQGKVLTIDEQTNVANAYKARNLLTAGYVALNLPIGKLNIYGGLRAEFNRLIVDGYYNPTAPVHVNNPALNLFPSINASYNLSEKTLLRLAYAHTINRPEFREVSPFSYYDFTEKVAVRGNPELLDASIGNLDLRIEHYPSPNETFSLAAFYKKFNNPIEMVNVAASEFSFQNALAATNFGLEFEMKRSLEKLIGWKNFSINMNASYIYSEVKFADNQTEKNRPLQGQSPFVVNVGLFYQNEKAGLSSTLMYNVIGKRILVAALLNQGVVVAPDIYEMPRNVVDFSLNKKIGERLEFKIGIKDLLSQDYKTQQTFEYVKGGESKSATLTNKVYNQGRTFSVGINWKL